MNFSPQNYKDFPPKAKFPGNEIPKFHIFSMHAELPIHVILSWNYGTLHLDDELVFPEIAVIQDPVLPGIHLHWYQTHLHTVVCHSHPQVVYPSLQHGNQMNNSSQEEMKTVCNSFLTYMVYNINILENIG